MGIKPRRVVGKSVNIEGNSGDKNESYKNNADITEDYGCVLRRHRKLCVKGFWFHRYN